jgi:site-specific DNA recombinase
MPKYFMYCRKSSEDEDRQMLSIDAQLRELKEFAIKQRLDIVEVFTESMTAKAPGRPIFNRMLEALKDGEADGILAWNPDRLARNSKDGGEIIYLIDQGVIKDLRFPTYMYDSSPHGKFNLSLAFGFSKLFIDNLVQNVNRGLREKIKRGEYPGLAPRGYINNPKTRQIDINPKCFDIIKEVFEKYAIGSITLPEIRKELFKHGMQTRAGNPLSFTTIKENMLSNPFYYGVFKLKGELHPGTHQAMISKDTFDRIQERLNDNSKLVNWTKTKRNSKKFLFDQVGKCGNCGFSIIREYHQKKSGLEFRYYRCSRKSQTCECKELAINENDLKPQVENILSEIALKDDWFKHSMELLEYWKEEEQHSLSDQIKECELFIKNNEKRIDKLLDIYIDGGLSKEEYNDKKNQIINENIKFTDKITAIQNKASVWFEPLSSALKTCNQAHHKIREKNHEKMFEILKMTGLNRQMSKKKFSLDYSMPFSFFRGSGLWLAKHNSPETIHVYQNIESKAWSGVKANQWGSGEAASSLVRRQPLTLSSAHTAVQPRQSHCTAKAVGSLHEASEQTAEQVAKGVVRAAGSGYSEGVLSEVGLRWYRRPDLNRHRNKFPTDFKSVASTNSATSAR